MAIGSSKLPPLYPIDGVRLGTTSAGIKIPGRPDLVVIEFSETTSVAGVFTRNAFCAAPVTIAKQHMTSENKLRYFIVNTGNANAGTGDQGIKNTLKCCTRLANLCSLPVGSVLPFSTGVIGENLPVELICAALPAALDDLNDNGWAQAAAGIMTTDTRPKAASHRIRLAGKEVTLTGIAKGAGMIKPNMATMLGYIASDIKIDQVLLQKALTKAVDSSFNRITVDGDTSTNDACMALATGTSEVVIASEDEPDFSHFCDALTSLCLELAQGLIRDAEGASKFVEVAVAGGANLDECLAVAYAVAESPLVKTALYASDPNWGRILAAIGRAGLSELNVEAVSICLNGLIIAEDGCRAVSYNEAKVTAEMEKDEVKIVIDLARGCVDASIYTCDLSNEYVSINADYRT